MHLELKKQEIYGTRTMEKNRTNKSPLLSNRKGNEKEGQMVSSETDVLVRQGLDNKILSVASNIQCESNPHGKALQPQGEETH